MNTPFFCAVMKIIGPRMLGLVVVPFQRGDVAHAKARMTRDREREQFAIIRRLLVLVITLEKLPLLV